MRGHAIAEALEVIVSEASTAAPSVLRPLTRRHIPALAGLTRANREFLAPTSPLRPEAYFTDEGQERAALELLHAAENGTALPMVVVDAADPKAP